MFIELHISYISDLNDYLSMSHVFLTLQMSDLHELGKIRFPLALPFGLDLNTIKSTNDCRWIHPVKVDVLGSWRVGHQTKMDPVLDLIIIIPQVRLVFFFIFIFTFFVFLFAD